MRPITPIPAVALVMGLVFAAAGHASEDGERPEHFEGKPAETLEQAFTNFAEANARLKAVLAGHGVDDEDMVEIHRLTYTLENALERIDEEVDDLSEALEELHMASERLDRETIGEVAPGYLSGAGKLSGRGD